ncbi:MAG: PAS domain-containing protein [Rickettsiales bacterium]
MTDDNNIYPYGERRLGQRLLRYWREKRSIHAMPVENDIDPEELGTDWDYCFLLQSRDVANVQDYNFTYLGQKIMTAYFDKAIDEHNQFMVGPNAYRLSNHFARVIETRAPVLDEGEFLTLHGHKVLYRQVLLPLGDDSKPVEAIFGGMNYKIIK